MKKLNILTLQELKDEATELGINFPKSAGQSAMIGIIYTHLMDNPPAKFQETDTKELEKLESYLSPDLNLTGKSREFLLEKLMVTITCTDPDLAKKGHYSAHIQNDVYNYGQHTLRFGVPLAIPRVFVAHYSLLRYTSLLRSKQVHTDDVSPERLQQEQPLFNMQFLKPLTNEEIIKLMRRRLT